LLAGFGEGVEQSLFVSDSPHDNAGASPMYLESPASPLAPPTEYHFQGQQL